MTSFYGGGAGQWASGGGGSGDTASIKFVDALPEVGEKDVLYVTQEALYLYANNKFINLTSAGAMISSWEKL